MTTLKDYYGAGQDRIITQEEIPGFTTLTKLTKAELAALLISYMELTAKLSKESK